MYPLYGVSVVGYLMLQPWDTMSLIQADLGLVRGRARAHLGSLKHPKRINLYPLYTSLCIGELNTIRKQNAFSAVLSTEGRVVGLCWAQLKPKGPEGPKRTWSQARRGQVHLTLFDAGGRSLQPDLPVTIHTLSHAHCTHFSL